MTHNPDERLAPSGVIRALDRVVERCPRHSGNNPRLNRPVVCPLTVSKQRLFRWSGRVPGRRVEAGAGQESRPKKSVRLGFSPVKVPPSCSSLTSVQVKGGRGVCRVSERALFMISKSKPDRPVNSPRWVPNNCQCGSKGGQYLVHYGIMRCECGRFHWALQPKRGGPLVMFAYPGDARLMNPAAEKEAA
jgi:hypothetical protein